MIQLEDSNNERILTENEDYVKNFLHPKNLTIATDVTAPKLAKTAVIAGAQIFVPLADLVNIDDEIKRMTKEEKDLQAEVERSTKKLNNQGFVAHAPEAVINKEKAKKADYENQLQSVQERIQELKKSE